MPVDLTEEFLQDYARLEKENEAWRNGAQKTPALETLQKAHDALQAKYHEVATQLADAEAKAARDQRLLEAETARHQGELAEKQARHAEEISGWEQKLSNANEVIKDMENSRPVGSGGTPPPGPLVPQPDFPAPPDSPEAAARIEELENQIEDLRKEKGDLKTQVEGLTRDKNILEAERSILRPPP